MNSQIWDVLKQLKQEQHKHNLKQSQKITIDGNEVCIETYSSNVPESTLVCTNKDCIAKIGQQSKLILYDGNFVCEECDTLQRPYIDDGQEWRDYGHEDNRSGNASRCNAPTIGNCNLSNVNKGSSNGGGSGSMLVMEMGRKNMSKEVYHAVRQNQWSSWSHKDKSLNRSLEYLTVRATNAGISKFIIDEACEIFKVGIVQHLLRSDNRHGLEASSVYVACRNNGVPRSLNEIEKMFLLNRGSITDANKILSNYFQIENTVDPDDFIMRFCSRLGFDFKFIDLCKFILIQVEKHNIISGNAPDSIAAGTVYLVNIVYDMGFSRHAIGEACGPSEITINKCYKQMNKYLEHILPADVYEMYTSRQKKKRKPKSKAKAKAKNVKE
jgi:transcription initiation factor TFIIB